VITGSSSFNPPYYGLKLMQYFVRPGDTVLGATSDYPLLSTYAARKADGALTMLVINKDTTATFNARIALTNFLAWTNATLQSYGIPQDQAVENNQSSALQNIATTNFAAASTNFTSSFPPLSLNLFTFAPAAPVVQSASVTGTEYQFQFQGQTGVPYQIQSSTNLLTWTSNATITLSGTIGAVTNNLDTGTRFWRAVWLP
jgi:hypothetical protein